MKRLYSDLIRRRARVRISPAVEPEFTCKPIFVVGMYRSGTTLLRYILDAHSRLACPPESAFLRHLDVMSSDDRSRCGLDSLGFDENHVLARTRPFAAYFFESYAASRGKPRWVDKSPIYVDHLPFLRKLFPSAQMLIIFRHPLDQIDSAWQRGTIRKEELAPYRLNPYDDPRLVHARYWADKAQRIESFRARESNKSLMIRYEELCANAESVLRPVFSFLGEEWEDDVLRFYDFNHDRGNEDGRVNATRGFLQNSHNYMSWPGEAQEACWEIVAPVASRLGYEL